MFNTLKKQPTEELQALLQALVRRVIAEQIPDTRSMDRYEELLAEIYRRGEKPKAFLTVNESKE